MALPFGLVFFYFSPSLKTSSLGIKWMVQQEAVLCGMWSDWQTYLSCRDKIVKQLFARVIVSSIWEKFQHFHKIWQSGFQLGLTSLEMIYIIFKLEPKQTCYPCFWWKGDLVWLLSSSWMWKYQFIWNIRYLMHFFQKQARI